MNLLCPNCQKTLTVPEQFAGQLMKCPLCSGTFTVPALPQGGEPAAAAPAPEPTPGFAPPPEPAAPAGEPMPAFSLPSSTPPTPAFSTKEPEPAFKVTPPSASPSPAPTKPASAPSPTSYSTSPSPGLSTGDYTRTRRLVFKENVLQWVPLACTLLIFVLQFFTWVGIYPGGVAAVTQNAWQAAFNGASEDGDMLEVKEERVGAGEKAEKVRKTYIKPIDLLWKEEPPRDPTVRGTMTISPLLFFYFLPFFLVTLPVTILVAALPYLHVKLPPQVERLLPWKWAILAGLNAVLLLFLTLQLMLNFSLETAVAERVKESINERFKDRAGSTKTADMKEIEAERGMRMQSLCRPTALTVVFILHVLSTAAAGLVYWMEKRGPGRPLPELELRW